MRIVLDEGVPRHLIAVLCGAGIEAVRFPTDFLQMRNGELIRRLDELGYDALLTNDKNIANQQSLRGRRIAVVALPHNRRSTIIGRAADIVDTLRLAPPGRHVVMEWDGRRTVTYLLDGVEVREQLPPIQPFSNRRRAGEQTP